MILEKVVVGAYQVNCYILASDQGKRALIIDPGDEPGRINQVLAKRGLTPALVVNTHGHIDHIGGDGEFGVPVYVHEQDAPFLRQPELNLSDFLARPYKVAVEIKTVKEGDVIEVDTVSLKVLHMPGHTPGGMALVLQGAGRPVVFTGDSLFYRSIGRTDFPGSDGRGSPVGPH